MNFSSALSHIVCPCLYQLKCCQVSNDFSNPVSPFKSTVADSITTSPASKIILSLLLFLSHFSFFLPFSTILFPLLDCCLHPLEPSFACVHVCIQNRQEMSPSGAGSDLLRDVFASRELQEQIPLHRICFSNNKMIRNELKGNENSL